MKYEDNKIATYQNGPDKAYGSTMWRHIYEIGKFWVVTDNGAFGQSIFVFLKEEVKDQKQEILMNFAFPKNISKSVSGWHQYYETFSEAIDRNLSEWDNPNQLVWYEEIEKQYFCGKEDMTEIRYSINNSETNKKRIEALPGFRGWANKYGNIGA